MKRLIAILSIALISLSASARDYNVSVFGIRSNGVTDNTASIQYAIDYISANGGGTLVFSVGRFVTGAVELRENVSIKIGAGATIIASDNIYAFKGHKAIFNAKDLSKVIIFGSGTVDGRADLVRASRSEQIEKGHVTESCPLPALFCFENCKDVRVKSLLLRNSPCAEAFIINEGSKVSEEGTFTDTPLVKAE